MWYSIQETLKEEMNKLSDNIPNFFWNIEHIENWFDNTLSISKNFFNKLTLNWNTIKNDNTIKFYKSLLDNNLLNRAELYKTDIGYIIDLTDHYHDILFLDPETWIEYLPDFRNLVIGFILDFDFNPLFWGDFLFLRTIRKEFFWYSANFFNEILELGFYKADARLTYDENFNYIDLWLPDTFWNLKKDKYFWFYVFWIAHWIGYTSLHNYYLSKDKYFNEPLLNKQRIISYNIEWNFITIEFFNNHKKETYNIYDILK